MAKYALIKDYKVEKVQELTEEEYLNMSYNYQNIIDVSSESSELKAGWCFDGRKFIPPTPITPAEYVSQSVIPSAKAFAVKLENDFITENILMGISQLGKTGAVLGILSKKVPIPNSSESVSLMETLRSTCPSLTATRDVLTYLIDNPNLYSDLSPFLTSDRLTSIRTKVLTYLG